jgi:replicative DNA helicase
MTDRSPTDRIPPQDLATERTVLGTMLVSPDALEMAATQLHEGCFYSSQNRIVYRSISEMVAAGIPIDVTTLANQMTKTDTLEAAGSEMYLAEICESLVSSANIEHYCNILLEKAMLRELIKIGEGLISRGYAPDVEAKDLLSAVESQIFSLSENGVKTKAKSMSELLPVVFREIENYSKGNTSGIKWGFSDLDQLTGGAHNSDLVIIAGRPGMGKTAFAMCSLINAALCGEPGVLFSLEMSDVQIAMRSLCAEARVSMHQLRSGLLPNRDTDKLRNAANPLKEAQIWIDDTPAITVSEVRSKGRLLKRTQGIRWIMVDYIQLMSGSGRTENRQQEVSNISRGLKAVAKELDIPVIALSQLSRKVEDRTDHRPQLSDLRESGAIEQDADVVMFVYRDEVYKQTDDNKGKAEIIVGKQRNGPCETVEVAFLKEFAKFENLSEQSDDNSFYNESGRGSV